MQVPRVSIKESKRQRGYARLNRTELQGQCYLKGQTGSLSKVLLSGACQSGAMMAADRVKMERAREQARVGRRVETARTDGSWMKEMVRPSVRQARAERKSEREKVAFPVKGRYFPFPAAVLSGGAKGPCSLALAASPWDALHVLSLSLPLSCSQLHPLSFLLLFPLPHPFPFP